MHIGSDGVLPQFAEIQKMATVPAKDLERAFLVLKPLSTCNYESHLHAYKIRTDGHRDTLVLEQSELISFRPMHVCRSIGDNLSKYVCPKYDIDIYSQQI